MSPKFSIDNSGIMGEHQSFLDGAIHGFRGPLRGIGISAVLLGERLNGRLDAEARDLLNSILDGVATLNSLTQALADYSMALLPNVTPAARLPVESALQSAQASLQDRIVETGAVIQSGELPRLNVPHEQITILFRNLLSNALEYRDLAPPHIEITATRVGEEWQFAFRDNGIGIAPRYQPQIFEPFKRLHGGVGRFGLGLAVARKIVTAYGGRIWVESQEGAGSTFFFTFPVHSDDPQLWL